MGRFFLGGGAVGFAYALTLSLLIVFELWPKIIHKHSYEDRFS